MCPFFKLAAYDGVYSLKTQLKLSSALKCLALVMIKPFAPNAPFLYPLKTLENQKVFLMFPGRRKRVHWEQMG